MRVETLPDGRLPTEPSARYVGVATKTMAMWRWQKRGPRWVKVAGRVFYYLEDLDAFIAAGKTGATLVAMMIAVCSALLLRYATQLVVIVFAFGAFGMMLQA